VNRSPKKTKTREPGTAWTGFILGGVLLLIMAVLAVTTAQRLQRGYELMQQSLTHQAMLIVKNLEGASRSIMRGGMWRAQVLQALVEEMAQHPSVHLLAILGPGDEILAVGRNQDFTQGGPLDGLPLDVKQAVEERAEVNRFTADELLVGSSFDPLRRFRSLGKSLPKWACPVDPNQEAPPEPGPPPGFPGPSLPRNAGQNEAGRGRGHGMRMGMGMGFGHHIDNPAFKGYALVRLSTKAFIDTRNQALKESLLLAVLIFLAAGLVAGGIWMAGRRRDAEISRLRREVAAAEHLAALGRLAGSVAHEVRNPLSAVRGLVQYLAKGEEPGSQKAEYAKAAVDEVDRLERVVSGLLDYTRPREPRRVALDMEESLQSVLNLMSDDPRASGVDIQLNMEPGLKQVQADPDQIRQVLVNLVVNALDALDGRGALTLYARNRQDGIEVEVADNGPGLPEGDPEQVFDPFFSTRERGTDLGLAIARRIMRSHGGGITAGRVESGGTRFTLVLPADGGVA
jgi:signal transduction histidine kinase